MDASKGNTTVVASHFRSPLTMATLRQSLDQLSQHWHGMSESLSQLLHEFDAVVTRSGQQVRDRPSESAKLWAVLAQIGQFDFPALASATGDLIDADPAAEAISISECSSPVDDITVSITAVQVTLQQLGALMLEQGQALTLHAKRLRSSKAAIVAFCSSGDVPSTTVKSVVQHAAIKPPTVGAAAAATGRGKRPEAGAQSNVAPQQHKKKSGAASSDAKPITADAQAESVAASTRFVELPSTTPFVPHLASVTRNRWATSASFSDSSRVVDTNTEVQTLSSLPSYDTTSICALLASILDEAVLTDASSVELINSLELGSVDNTAQISWQLPRESEGVAMARGSAGHRLVLLQNPEAGAFQWHSAFMLAQSGGHRHRLWIHDVVHIAGGGDDEPTDDQGSKVEIALTVSVDDDGNVIARCGWSSPSDGDEAAPFASAFRSLRLRQLKDAAVAVAERLRVSLTAAVAAAPSGAEGGVLTRKEAAAKGAAAAPPPKADAPVARVAKAIIAGVTAPVANFTSGVVNAGFPKAFPHIHEPLMDSFNCAWIDEGVLRQGFLYVTASYICFQASMLSGKFEIDNRDVKQFYKRATAKIMQNAIEIELVTGESYLLSSFLQRDAAFELLFQTWTNRT